MDGVLELPVSARKDTERKTLSKMYELKNKKNSDFVKEGTERSSNPQHLNSPATLKLSLRVPIMVPKIGKRLIQYIPNAPTLFIEDYDFVDENGKPQKGKGLKSLGIDLHEGYRAGTAKNIMFKNGFLNLFEYDEDPLLEEFIRIHPDNKESPYWNKRSASPLFSFECVKKAENAEKKIAPIEDEYKAVGLVLELRKKEGKTYKYDMPRIDAYLRMLGIGAGIAEAVDEEKIEVLIAYAKRAPLDFLEVIKTESEEYTMQIGLGVKSKVLVFDKKEAKFANDKKAFFVFDAESKNDPSEQLMFYFLSDAGAENYNTLVLKCSEAGAQSLK